MSEGLLLLLLVLGVSILIGVPIALSFVLSTLIAAMALGYDDYIIMICSSMANSIDNYALLAIPLFILTGELMAAGGLATRLIDFLSIIVMRVRGGIGLVNIISCVMFGAESGSATATVSSVGKALFPEMKKKGYFPEFSVAITASSAAAGLLFPPSNVMIIYAVVAGIVSIPALFMASIVPALLMLAVVVCVCLLRSGRVGEQEENLTFFSGKYLWLYGVKAFPSMTLLLMVLLGILSGVMTATEAAALGALGAFILTVLVYRDLKMSDLIRTLTRAATSTGVIISIMACSGAMSHLLIRENVPESVSYYLLNLSNSPLVLILIINIVLLLVGIVIDIAPAIMIFTPILLPVAIDLGIDPVHFGVIMVANLSIGCCAPPFGSCLILGSNILRVPTLKVAKEMIPFYIGMLAFLFLIVYVPAISTWLPDCLGMND